jgi:hypothetical protein
MSIENTRIYLLYYNEDIQEYLSDPRVVPIKLSQSIFMESDGFNKINESDIPAHIEYIGFITPSLMKKTGKLLSDLYHPTTPNTLVAISSCNSSTTYIQFANYYHPLFRVLWCWLIGSMGLDPLNHKYTPTHIHSNMWITNRSVALEYVAFAKRCMDTIYNAPPEIRALFNMDSQYGGKMTKERLREIFGMNHYPYYPFILERCIAFFCELKGVHVVKL